MAFRTVKEIKEYGVQMLSEDETDTVLAGSTAEGSHNLLGRWITKVYDEIRTHHSWHWLTASTTLTWPAANEDGGAVLYYPEDFDYLLTVDPQNSSRRYPVEIIRAHEYHHTRQINNRSRWTESLVELGMFGVEADNPSASTVTATSSVTSTDNGLVVVVEGRVSSRPRRERLTLAGAGTATSTNTFDAGSGGVQRAYIDDTTIPSGGGGIITITGGGGTTLEVLDSSNERMHEHRRTEMFDSFSSSTTYDVIYYRKPVNVTLVDSDLIELPEGFHDLMEIGIMVELSKLRKKWDDIKGFRMEWMQRLTELRAYSNRAPGRKINVRTARQWGGGSTTY